jgi:hypothetical protein
MPSKPRPLAGRLDKLATFQCHAIVTDLNITRTTGQELAAA